MTKFLTTAALALVLATPAFAVDLGADVKADVAVPAVGASVKNSTSTESHSRTATAPDGSASVHSEEKHSINHDSESHMDADVDMTVDDEE